MSRVVPINDLDAEADGLAEAPCTCTRGRMVPAGLSPRRRVEPVMHRVEGAITIGTELAGDSFRR